MKAEWKKSSCHKQRGELVIAEFGDKGAHFQSLLESFHSM